MIIGIVGYQGSGKSTLFEWLTGVVPNPALSHSTQSAKAVVPEARVAPLCEIYKPKKITLAALDLVDSPGLSRDHEGSAAKLAQIREAACLVVVVAAYGGANPLADLRTFEEDLLIADLDIVSGRVERLREALKKPKPGREEQEEELAALEPLLAVLEAGQSLEKVALTPEQAKVTRSFRLFCEKPRLTVLNLADDETTPDKVLSQLPPGTPAVAVSLSLQLELAKMPEPERADFCAEMGVAAYDRDSLLRKVMDVSGQMLFFTAGEKEVRTWMLNKGGTAVEAAGNIHTDLARGFIRAETMSCADLIRLGSEREIKAHNLLRHEPKDYVIQDGDIINIRFSVEPAMKFVHLNHVALHVADVEQSARFYTEVLRLEPMPRPAFSFPGAWFRLGAEQELHLIGERTDPVISKSRGNHYALLVDDLDAWERHFRDLEVPYLPRRTRPDGAFQIYVSDPDGYAIELCTLPPGR